LFISKKVYKRLIRDIKIKNIKGETEMRMSQMKTLNNMLEISNWKLLLHMLKGRLKNHYRLYLFGDGKVITTPAAKEPMEMLRAEPGYYRVYCLKVSTVSSIKRELKEELDTIVPELNSSFNTDKQSVMTLPNLLEKTVNVRNA